MATDVKKTKASDIATASKEVGAASKEAGTAAKKESPPAEVAKAEPAKAESGDAATAAPVSYSRGEGQKQVTQAYRDNWNAIYGDKKKKKR